jgi:hypothetical protein
MTGRMSGPGSARAADAEVDSQRLTEMSIDPIKAQPAQPAVQPTAPPRSVDPTSFADALDEAAAALPATPDAPPSEALAAVQTANEVYAQLRALDRELRFAHTPHGVLIEVYNGDGQLVQRVPATEVLKISSGEKTWLA